MQFSFWLSAVQRFITWKLGGALNDSISSAQLTLRRAYIHWIFCRRIHHSVQVKAWFPFLDLRAHYKMWSLFSSPSFSIFITSLKIWYHKYNFNAYILSYISNIDLFLLYIFLTFQFISISLRCLPTSSRNIELLYLKLHLVLSAQW